MAYLEPNSNSEGGSIFLVIMGFILAILSAVTVGYLLKKFLMVGLCILAAVAGFMLGLMTYNLLFVGWLKSSILLASLTFIPAFLGAYYAYKHGDTIVILVTSLIGAYLTVRGVSMFFGGFPNEVSLYQEISNGTASFSYWFLGYLSAIMILTIVGVIY